MASYERYKEYASLTAAELAAVNNIFPEGQLVVEADTGKMKVGDGTTAYNSLPYGPTTLSSLTLPNGTANGVLYLDGSKVVTSGSALTFNGSTLATTGALTVDGNTTLGNATTDTVQVNGYMGVGGNGAANVGVYARNSALTAATQIGVQSEIVGTSAATSNIRSFASFPSTAAASFTNAVMAGFYAGDAIKGAGSTITNQHGVFIADQTQGTNNFGITSLVSSGANKWNIFASGSAQNYFGGRVGLGTTVPLGVLDATGTVYSRFLNTTAPTLNNDTHDGEALYLRSGGTAGAENVQAVLAFGKADSSSQRSGAAIASIQTTSDADQIGLAFYVSASTSSLQTMSERFRIGTSEAVFNEASEDYDFRVESDTNTHALFVQGSDGNVGIGTSSPNRKLQVVDSVAGGTFSALALWNNTTNTADTKTLFEMPVFNGANGFSITSFGSSSDSYNAFITTGQASASLIFGSGANNERLRITSAGNVSIGGTADRATTVGTAALNIFNGTAPVGTLTNGISIYSSAGEAYVMDAAGNATLFSPHDAETNEWIFKSKHTPTGKVLKIDVEKLLRFVNDHFGLDAVQEFIEP